MKANRRRRECLRKTSTRHLWVITNKKTPKLSSGASEALLLDDCCRAESVNADATTATSAMMEGPNPPGVSVY